MLLLIYPRKSYRHPAPRELAEASVVYYNWQYLIAKIRINEHNTKQKQNFFVFTVEWEYLRRSQRYKEVGKLQRKRKEKWLSREKWREKESADKLFQFQLFQLKFERQKPLLMIYNYLIYRQLYIKFRNNWPPKRNWNNWNWNASPD